MSGTVPRETGEADALLDRFAVHLATSPHNLISRADRPDVVPRHIEPARLIVGALDMAAGSSWMDLGTGGGLPGVVLAALRPDVRLTLLDARQKKMRVLQDFVAEQGIANVSLVTARAEDAARRDGLRGAYDGVVARAVARLDVLAELARGFLRPDGVLVAVKRPTWRDEPAVAPSTWRRLRFGPMEERVVESPAGPLHLITMRAAGAGPSWVPRGVGVPNRQPLGTSA